MDLSRQHVTLDFLLLEQPYLTRSISNETIGFLSFSFILDEFNFRRGAKHAVSVAFLSTKSHQVTEGPLPRLGLKLNYKNNSAGINITGITNGGAMGRCRGRRLATGT